MQVVRRALTEPEPAAVGADGRVHGVELGDSEAGVVEHVLAGQPGLDVVVVRAVRHCAVLPGAVSYAVALKGETRTLMGADVVVGMAGAGTSTQIAQ